MLCNIEYLLNIQYLANNEFQIYKDKNHNIAIVMSSSHADPVLGLNILQG